MTINEKEIEVVSNYVTVTSHFPRQDESTI
jgi:hypothetical protein